MAILLFSFLAYTQSKNGHISVTMILRVLPKTLAIICNALNVTLVTVFCGYVSYTLFLQGAYAVRKGLKTALILIPLSPFYYFAAVCMVIFTVTLLADALIAVAAIWNKNYSEYVEGSLS